MVNLSPTNHIDNFFRSALELSLSQCINTSSVDASRYVPSELLDGKYVNLLTPTCGDVTLHNSFLCSVYILDYLLNCARRNVIITDQLV